MSIEDLVDKYLNEAEENNNKKSRIIPHLKPTNVDDFVVSSASPSFKNDEDELINSLINDLKPVEDTSDTLGKDLQVITKECVRPSNRFIFGFMDKQNCGWDALLATIGDKPKDRYDFAAIFRYHYHTDRSAVKGQFFDKFKEIVSSIIGFRGMLAYREAGVRSDIMESEKKTGLLDRLKK